MADGEAFGEKPLDEDGLKSELGDGEDSEIF